jgi:hypothetical protein
MFVVNSIWPKDEEGYHSYSVFDNCCDDNYFYIVVEVKTRISRCRTGLNHNSK